MNSAEEREEPRPPLSRPVESGRDVSFSRPDSHRIAELELENLRLHRLVAELLLKNQQLRKVD
ncbi:hypothetical protein EDE15_4376 [Edaphobacter aggregans]|uniref:Uncharacterized protein n=1 Tax=Edaphobacter aggregans TaxID=570835 RepID=A0A3R9QDK8_9BACT|nr:hypothetical protein EDE15_4376 [Edaphobacter aggregans]